MNILLTGLPKSGTSALMMRVRAMFPNHRRNFERFVFLNEEELSNGVICKDLLQNAINYQNKPNYNRFDKIVAIVRDPRDRLVSAILYAGFNVAWKKPEMERQLLEKLRQKEADPVSVTCDELATILGGTNYTIPTMNSEKHLLTSLAAIEKLNKPMCILRYEDFIQDYSDLGRFLGSSSHMDERPLYERRVYRSGRSGEWKQWFTPHDVENFLPLVADVMERFGYVDEPLPAEQKIDPETASEFAARKIKERQNMHRKPASPPTS